MDAEWIVFIVVLSVAVAAVGLLAIMFGVETPVKQFVVKRRLVAADAIVKNISKVDEEPDEDGDIYVNICVTVEYGVDGRVISGDYKTEKHSSVSASEWRMSPGDSTRNHYDPKHPEFFTMDAAYNLRTLATGIVAILMGVGAIMYACYTVVDLFELAVGKISHEQRFQTVLTEEHQ